MLYAKKDANGKVQAVSQAEIPGYALISSDDIELRLFLETCHAEASSLTQSDMDFVRVVEDLIELLISKNYILFTELPEKAREKIHRRRILRGEKNGRLDLLDDEFDSLL